MGYCVKRDSPKTMENMAHKHIGMIMMSNEKLMEILKNYTVIRMPDELFNDKLTWCMEHCQYKFRDIRETNDRAWYFESPTDATIFAIKWAQ